MSCDNLLFGINVSHDIPISMCHIASKKLSCYILNLTKSHVMSTVIWKILIFRRVCVAVSNLKVKAPLL